MPLFIKRAHRDEDFIQKIAAEIAQFNDELAAMVDRVRAYQTPVFKRQLEQSLVMAG
jgi:pyruvate/2-oxoglutarate/acetoin dehydrogenase E1 component